MDVILVLVVEQIPCFHLNMMILLIWGMTMAVNMDNMEHLMSSMRVVLQWLDVVLVFLNIIILLCYKHFTNVNIKIPSG